MPNAAGNVGRVTDHGTGRPVLELETHLLEAPDSDALAHELSASCWCGPEVQIVHRLAAPASTPSTIPDHQVVSLDELRKRGDL
jgi:hypothetical protein